MDFFTKRYHPPGTPPGTLVEEPLTADEPMKIRLVDYHADEIVIKENIDALDCHDFLQRDTVTWLHIQGKPTETALREIGELFQLHPLALEDVMNKGQRPKVEAFDDQLFIVMNSPIMENDLVKIEQASFFLSSRFIISFYEHELDPFLPILKRLKDNHSRLRTRSIDFLMYSLLDVVIDQGFPVLEDFGQQLEDLEEVILGSSKNSLETIHVVKRELILMRRMLWPQREVMNHLLRGDIELIQDDTRIYLRDCYDHTIQVMDLMETYRDMTSSMLDIYLSSVSNRMNEIMRVLTVVSSIFIPLTFIAGVYGMNFNTSASHFNMPELGLSYGYPLVIGFMFMIAVAMLIFFRRRDWL